MKSDELYINLEFFGWVPYALLFLNPRSPVITYFMNVIEKKWGIVSFDRKTETFVRSHVTVYYVLMAAALVLAVLGFVKHMFLAGAACIFLVVVPMTFLMYLYVFSGRIETAELQ